MYTKPIHGWTDVTIGGYTSRASYLTDIPFDSLDNAIEAIRYGHDMRLAFDAEGWEFIMIADDKKTELYVDGEHSFNMTIQKTIYEWAQEIVTDIEAYLDEWSHWLHDPELDGMDKIEANKKELKEKTEELKALLQNKHTSE